MMIKPGFSPYKRFDQTMIETVFRTDTLNVWVINGSISGEIDDPGKNVARTIG
ncbi:hypothetical protein DAMNIGENAA_08730 [Desulforhabdus amnigena]|uniref:Uncharacterized protein n=1 Tax=Desulforhabdus amnigena TaxID=40218 RepID=A0A9W6FTB1_9BACT|nr:hypothetical protein DAMNIGENAA_08730 [Desulforhabdus amnigena]